MDSSLACILIEDEALGVEMMVDYISRRNDLVLQGIAMQLSEVPDLLLNCSPSIIFLDLIIPYGDANSFSFLQFPGNLSFVIISATPINYFKGALPSGELYELLKPISFNDFNTCVNRVMQNLKSN